MNTSDIKDIERLLSIEDESEIGNLFSFADEVRRRYVGDEVLTRGIIEFSNYCGNGCFYCGINRNNTSLKRYRLTKDQIMESVAAIASRGITTAVLQSGEDPALDPLWLKDVIEEIKVHFDLAVTLSVGEKKRSEYKLWRGAGADRYLLKIETSDEKLYESLHPGMNFKNRLRCLRDLKELGYETGSGMMIGLPGQSLSSIAQDMIFLKDWDFDMIAMGPFIPHPGTKLAGEETPPPRLILKVLAVARIVTKRANIPATTALGEIDDKSRAAALKCGANVIMHNFTPAAYKPLYDIYPRNSTVWDSKPSTCSQIQR